VNGYYKTSSRLAFWASLLRRYSFLGMISRRRIRRSREYVTLLHLPDALRLIMPTNTGVTVMVMNLLSRLKWEGAF